MTECDVSLHLFNMALITWELMVNTVSLPHIGTHMCANTKMSAHMGAKMCATTQMSAHMGAKMGTHLCANTQMGAQMGAKMSANSSAEPTSSGMESQNAFAFLEVIPLYNLKSEYIIGMLDPCSSN